MIRVRTTAMAGKNTHSSRPLCVTSLLPKSLSWRATVAADQDFHHGAWLGGYFFSVVWM
ncbi:hypothetical protein BD779DRAFT_1570341 [Infundibulicybe gibba]|nr:hypothetical protein BD779DRAFT_1570341 [Infundibulicybe gibba]